jgi:Primase X
MQTETIMTLKQGLDFILSHLQVQDSVFPRTISTRTTEGRQILVNSEKEALARFAQANHLDCRVSAYPPKVTENPSAIQRFMGIRIATPANLIIMIDLDWNNFKTQGNFKTSFFRVMQNIKIKLDAIPTVLWSGRGYHIIIPLCSNGIILENVREFENVDDVSLKFLRYAELSLSLKNSDPQHTQTVSFNNCMLRVPGSVNSKNGQTVRVLQKWNYQRSGINYLLAGFTRYILNEQYTALIKMKKQIKSSSRTEINNHIGWIDSLLRTPMGDRRKYCVWRILIPYLLNIRKLPEGQIMEIINDWLSRCNQIRKLDFNHDQRISDAILRSKRTRFFPIGLEKLKEEDIVLYQYILSNADKLN